MSKSDTLRIAGIVRESIVDGPGIRFVIFCQGCPHACPGCHNGETHDFAGGYDCGIDRILAAIDENPLLSGVTFSGGEPACQCPGFADLAEEIKKRNLNIMMYSGYTFEQLLQMAEEDEAMSRLLANLDYLVDGPYIEEKRDLTLLFRGSSNQRILDVPASLKAGRACEKENF